MDQPSSRSHPPQPISLKQRVWLEKQVGMWQEAQLIGGEQAQAILQRYESAESVHGRLSQRLFMALAALAVVMCGAGVLMLIGYNWDAISRPVKVGMIFTAVAGTFAASAVAYQKKHAVAGEVLALLGTLFYGSAIWLLAQVFHIEAHYPDGVMWWMIGALATAWLVQSTIIGVEAVLLAAIWVVMEAAGFSNANYLYQVFAAAILGLAYVRTSGWLLALWILTTAIWILSAGASTWKPSEITPAVLVLFGCACYGSSQWRIWGAGLAKIWRVFGLGVLLIPLMLLTFKWMHRSWGMDDFDRLMYQGVWLLVGGLLLWIVWSIVRRKVAGLKADWPILLMAGACVYAIAAMALPFIRWPENATPSHEEAMLLLFSGVTVIFSLWLMVRGVRQDRGVSFFTGIIYMLAFVLVRWIDLIGDLISSAILFFIAGAVLFAAAWFWRKRKVIFQREAGNDSATVEE